MSILEMISSGCGIALILLTLIQISPIKIDPWSALARAIGKVLNADVLTKLERQEKKINTLSRNLDSLKKHTEEKNATASRYRILRFDDEIRHEQKHTKEHFDQILVDIDEYEKYCQAHPDYKNNIATSAIKKIKETYENCRNEKSFL